MKIQHKSVRKSARFNEARDQEIREGLHFDEALFAIDDCTLLGLLARERALLRDNSIKETLWPTIDNQMHRFKRDRFFDFVDAVCQYRDGMYMNCWKKKGRKV